MLLLLFIAQHLLWVPFQVHKEKWSDMLLQELLQMNVSCQDTEFHTGGLVIPQQRVRKSGSGLPWLNLIFSGLLVHQSSLLQVPDPPWYVAKGEHSKNSIFSFIHSFIWLIFIEHLLCTKLFVRQSIKIDRHRVCPHSTYSLQTFKSNHILYAHRWFYPLISAMKKILGTMKYLTGKSNVGEEWIGEF